VNLDSRSPLLKSVDIALGIGRLRQAWAAAPHWRGEALRPKVFYAFRRLRRAINLTAEPVLVELLREIQSFPEAASPAEPAEDQVIVPLRVRTSVGVLSFFTTIMVFGTPIDVTLSELALESFLPADKETAEIVARLPPT
jgi:hypothetical protein